MSESSLQLQLEGYEGPLDLLLELARAQKVDLAKISIVALVEQFLAVVEGARRIRLELAADWLVMAAWLAWLKSRLLIPPEQVEGEDAEAGGVAEDAEGHGGLPTEAGEEPAEDGHGEDFGDLADGQDGHDPLGLDADGGAAEEAAGDGTCEGAALAAAFNFDRADRGDATGLDRLGTTGFAA